MYSDAVSERLTSGERYAKALVLRLLVPLTLPGATRMKLLRYCGVTVGDGTQIRSRCTFTQPHVTFGERCWVNFGVTFDASAPITVSDQVTIAYHVNIVTATHELGDSTSRAGTPRAEPVQSQSGCWIGTGATILPGVTVGQGCMIAAGAVVVEDCAPNGLYAGAPARRVREL